MVINKLQNNMNIAPTFIVNVMGYLRDEKLTKATDFIGE